jgi:sulfatase maturation enzyme AslB (radical SAM superfamily)
MNPAGGAPGAGAGPAGAGQIGAAGITLTFDQATVDLDALQRSAYAVAAEMTVDIRVSGAEIEFQGGEPLLNFPLIRWITAEAKRMNAGHGKDLAFVIATNLALLDDEILEFCAEQDVHLSTSLDGPQHVHNGNRRRPGQDSWQQAVAGIRRAQERLGPDRVSALMTTTEASLDRAAEIIDAYADLGLRGVFLRPISPYGFALRGRGGANCAP